MNKDNYELLKIKLEKVENVVKVKDDITLEKYISLHEDDYKQPMIFSNIDNPPLDYSIHENNKYRTVRDKATDAFVNLMKSLGDIEISRTGVSAMSRGYKTETKIINKIFE